MMVQRPPESPLAVVRHDPGQNASSSADQTGQLPPPPAEDGAGTIPLSLLIELAVQKVYHDLTVRAELMQNDDIAKKMGIIDFAHTSRMLFIRLLALVKWLKSSSKVDVCSSINFFLDRQAACFVETADRLSFITRQELVQARLPAFQVPSAVDVLTLGSYPRLPVCIKSRFVPPQPISSREKTCVLNRLSQLIKHRLMKAAKLLPRNVQSVVVKNGYVTIRVRGEFEVCLTVLGEAEDTPWSLLNVSILCDDSSLGDGLPLVHPLQLHHIHQLAQTRASVLGALCVRDTYALPVTVLKHSHISAQLKAHHAFTVDTKLPYEQLILQFDRDSSMHLVVTLLCTGMAGNSNGGSGNGSNSNSTEQPSNWFEVQYRLAALGDCHVPALGSGYTTARSIRRTVASVLKLKSTIGSKRAHPVTVDDESQVPNKRLHLSMMSELCNQVRQLNAHLSCLQLAKALNTAGLQHAVCQNQVALRVTRMDQCNLLTSAEEQHRMWLWQSEHVSDCSLYVRANQHSAVVCVFSVRLKGEPLASSTCYTQEYACSNEQQVTQAVQSMCRTLCSMMPVHALWKRLQYTMGNGLQDIVKLSSYDWRSIRLLYGAEWAYSVSISSAPQTNTKYTLSFGMADRKAANVDKNGKAGHQVNAHGRHRDVFETLLNRPTSNEHNNIVYVLHALHVSSGLLQDVYSAMPASTNQLCAPMSINWTTVPSKERFGGQQAQPVPPSQQSLSARLSIRSVNELCYRLTYCNVLTLEVMALEQGDWLAVRDCTAYTAFSRHTDSVMVPWHCTGLLALCQTNIPTQETGTAVGNEEGDKHPQKVYQPEPPLQADALRAHVEEPATPMAAPGSVSGMAPSFSPATCGPLSNLQVPTPSPAAAPASVVSIHTPVNTPLPCSPSQPRHPLSVGPASQHSHGQASEANAPVLTHSTRPIVMHRSVWNQLCKQQSDVELNAKVDVKHRVVSDEMGSPLDSYLRATYALHQLTSSIMCSPTHPPHMCNVVFKNGALSMSIKRINEALKLHVQVRVALDVNAPLKLTCQLQFNTGVTGDGWVPMGDDLLCLEQYMSTQLVEHSGSAEVFSSLISILRMTSSGVLHAFTMLCKHQLDPLSSSGALWRCSLCLVSPMSPYLPFVKGPAVKLDKPQEQSMLFPIRFHSVKRESALSGNLNAHQCTPIISLIYHTATQELIVYPQFDQQKQLPWLPALSQFISQQNHMAKQAGDACSIWSCIRALMDNFSFGLVPSQ